MSDTPENNQPAPPSEPAASAPPPQQPQWVSAAPRPGYAPKPEKEKGGFGKGFGAGLGFALGAGVVAVVASIISGLMFIAAMASAIPTAAGKASIELSTVWGADDAEGKLRAIELAGPILADASDGAVLQSGAYGYEIAKSIDDLEKDDAAGLILLVNTPGGSVVGSSAIAEAVDRYQERTGQKVLVHVSSMSASGGVYSTSSADEIWADEGSLVGSIGVISGPFQRYTNVTAIGSTLLQAGVEAEKIEQEYLSAGKGKSFGDPFNEMSPEQRAQWMEMINTSYDTFVRRMVEGRGMDEKTIRDEMGAGLFGTDKAKEYKLIDGVKGRPDFFAHAAKQAGLDPENTRVEMATAPDTFLSSMLGIERVYGQSLPASQGEGITPMLSQAMCNPTAVLAYHGSATAICG